MTATERLWRVSLRLGLAPTVSRLYWQTRLAASGWRYQTHVGDVTATFKTTTKTEFLRASTLLGERDVVEAFVADLDGTETVWDVGACVGTYACLAAAASTSGTVVAIEPEPTNRRRLVTNLSTNAPRERWVVKPVALTDRDGLVHLERGTVEPGSGHHFLSPTGRGIDIPGWRAESLVAAGVPTPDVVKLDVQGAELDVLRGFGPVLDDVSRIYAELHVEKSGRYGSNAEEVELFLADSGFDVTRLGAPDYNREGVYHVVARRP